MQLPNQYEVNRNSEELAATITNVLEIVSNATITAQGRQLPAINQELARLQQYGQALEGGQLVVDSPPVVESETDDDDTV